jgi:ATP-dependent Clp protease ATP-binding subunit ClpB
VLLDEVEKAHRNVLTVLLQMLDDGRLTDSKGRVVDCSNTIVMLTTNLGAQYLMKEAEKRAAAEEAAAAQPSASTTAGGGSKRGRVEMLGSGGGTTSEFSSGTDMDVDELAAAGGGLESAAVAGISKETEARVMAAIKAHFLPELLNRLDEIVIFSPLRRPELRAIVALQVREMAKRLEDRDVTLVCGDDALDQVLRESYNPVFGARPMRRYIDKHLATQLSRMVIEGSLTDHGECVVHAGAEPGKFAITFKRNAAHAAAAAASASSGGAGAGGSAMRT